MGQFRLERLQVVVAREVVLGLRPGRDREDNPVDQLADARLALFRPEVAAEVLADDDVRGELAPEIRNLDVLLLEDELARLVADRRGPRLPGDLVVGMNAGRRPAALEGQALRSLAAEAGTVRSGQGPRLCLGSIHDRDRLAALSGHRSSLLHRVPECLDRRRRVVCDMISSHRSIGALSGIREAALIDQGDR